MTDKIIEQQLAELGIPSNKPEKKFVPSTKTVGELYEEAVAENKRAGNIKSRIKRRPDLFDMPDIPPALDRRTPEPKAETEWKPSPVVQSGRCRELHGRLTELRTAMAKNTGQAHANIKSKDLDELTDILSRNLGDLMEHAGFIHISGDAALRFKDYIRMYLLTNCKVYNGDMYRYPVEVK